MSEKTALFNSIIIATPNQDLSLIVQERLFELDFKWAAGGHNKEIKNTDQPILHINLATKIIRFSKDINIKGFKQVEFAYLYSKAFIDKIKR